MESLYGGEISYKDWFDEHFWTCPKCGSVYRRVISHYFCPICDKNYANEAQEKVIKQLQEIDKEIEEYHKNKLKDMI